MVLLFDSVSSHIDPDIFLSAKERGIVPNATHLMQPLDKGVFGPLKTKWHIVCRKNTRENPGKVIGKKNFAEKLTEAYLQFYKPLAVMNAFKASGIYPVDSTVITSEMLKPSLTLADRVYHIVLMCTRIFIIKPTQLMSSPIKIQYMDLTCLLMQQLLKKIKKKQGQVHLFHLCCWKA